jgi:hypothetical protein
MYYLSRRREHLKYELIVEYFRFSCFNYNSILAPNGNPKLNEQKTVLKMTVLL